ncbi:MAG: hypothetical protein HN826_15965 [Methylococcales bacterium]|jgi:p-aminobenzoyl-glutamate transporter AbgT|nr:hypothetical protein [Methylococcales bacterium]
MEMVYFTLAAIALYVISDKILVMIETKRGELLPNRSIIFFIIIMILSVITFTFIQAVFDTPSTAGTSKITTQTEQTKKPNL